jgi:hypothetical protein
LSRKALIMRLRIPQQIRILDGDLAQSGQLTTKRDDFKTLVSDVAMGQVGARARY